jgi:uncharacterized damage-inducible protein DinB
MEDAARVLLGHMEWADALIWNAVLAFPGAVADPVMKGRLYHVHVTQHAFLQLWRGSAREIPPSDSLDIPAMAGWARAFYTETSANAAWFSDAVLSGKAPETLVARAAERLGPGTGSITLGDTLLQVVTHTTYHRGQINTRLRELGCEPPLTEYFVWIWRGKPSAEWKRLI